MDADPVAGRDLLAADPSAAVPEKYGSVGMPAKKDMAGRIFKNLRGSFRCTDINGLIKRSYRVKWH